MEELRNDDHNERQSKDRANGKIIELKGCADRTTAQAYLASREALVLPPPLANHDHFGGE